MIASEIVPVKAARHVTFRSDTFAVEHLILNQQKHWQSPVAHGVPKNMKDPSRQWQRKSRSYSSGLLEPSP